MQTPLFWLDLSEYQGAKLKAIAADGKMKGLLVDMSAGMDEELAHTLRMLQFKQESPGKPHLLYSSDKSTEGRQQIQMRLTRSQEVPFSASDHLLIADVLREQEPAREPVKNDVQRQRDELDEAMGQSPAVEIKPRRATKEVISDVGTVKGFAIKDLRGRGDAILATIARMTEEQVGVHLTKNAIWPSPNYKELAASGMEPGAAYLLKEVRDSLRGSPNEQPKRRWASRKAANATVYAHAVSTMRDAFENVKTLDEAVEAVYGLSTVFAQTRREERSTRTVVWTSFKSPLENDANGEPIDDRDMQLVVKHRGDPKWQIAQSDDPESVASSKRRLRSDAEWRSRGNEQWTFLPRNHVLRTGVERTMSEDEKARRQEKEKDKAPTRVTRTTHANAVRKGMAHRHDGNVTGEQLVQRFDLSGAEFGNWESQADRQELLNQAFDSYSDLADVLGVPHEAIGLGGRLGMAFGSRGRGGKGAAAAHFEPTNNAINMTKHAGAGSLAHEWGHAFDRSLTSGGVNGRRAVMATDDANGMALELQGRALDNLRAGDRTAQNLNAVMRAIMIDPDETRERAKVHATRQVKVGLSTACASIDVKRVLYQWEGTAHEMAKYLSGALREKLEGELQEDFYLRPDDAAKVAARIESIAVSRSNDDEAAAKEIIGDLTRYLPVWDDMQVTALAARIENAIDSFDTIQSGCGAIGSLQGSLGDFTGEGMTDEWREDRERHAERLYEAAKRGARPAPSVMYIQAQKMDGDRSKPYWSRTEEMFARAFEAYVKSKIEGQGGRNDYLVSYAKPSTPNGKVFDSVYPTGDHLGRVAEAMDKMFAEISLEHVESASPLRRGQEGVIMYSIDGDAMTAGVPEPVKAEMLLADVRRMIGHIADVHLEDDLGEHAGHRVAGAYNTERRLIAIAMNGDDPRAATHHETFHAASEHLLDDTEHAIVSSAFDVGGRYRKDLERALLEDNKHHLISQIQTNPEEAMAYGFQYWMAGRLDVGAETPVGQLFKRVKDFYESVRNAVRGYTFMNTDEIFTRLEEGGYRERHEKLYRPSRPAHESAGAFRREEKNLDSRDDVQPKNATAGLSL